jgi:6-phosphogluconolactonase
MKTTKLTPSLFVSSQSSSTNKIRLGQAALRRFLLAVVLLLIYAAGVRAQGTFVYANDDAFPSNTVSGFSVGANGALTQIVGSPFSTGGTGGTAGFFAANRVTVSTAGRFLYASNSLSGSVGGFSINPATGFLTPVPGSPFLVDGFGSGLGYSLAVTPNNRFLFCANDTLGTISAFTIAANGSLASVPGSPFQLVSAIDGMKVSPDGRFLSAALPNVAVVAMLSIASNGALAAVPGSPFPASAGAFFPLVTGVDINCASNLLFAGIASINAPTIINVFNIAPNGALSAIAGSPFTFGGLNSNVPLLSPNGKFLFVSNQFSNGLTGSMTVLNVAANGALTQVAGSPFANPGGFFPSGIGTDAAGKFLFAANDNNTITAFSIASNGILGPVPGSPFVTSPFGNLLSLTVYPGKSCISFDTCLKDNNTGDVFAFNSSTGAYQYTRCRDGFSISGVGTLRTVNGVLSLTDTEPDRRVSGGFLMGQQTGRVTIMFMIGQGLWQTFTVNDTTSFGAGCTCGH